MATHRLTAAMFAGGVATFADLYAIQAVLPAVAGALTVGEATAALTISVATGALALAVLPWAFVADRIGRARAMTISVAVAAAAGMLVPFAPSMALLLVLRVVSGAALAAVPALAMAHLVELAPPGRAAAAAGVYIAGTTIGGLTGRILTGTVAGIVGGDLGWRVGLGATAIFVVALAVAFAVLLPRSPAPESRRGGPRGTAVGGRLRQALTGRAVWTVYLQGFLLMGGFVTLYNLLAFRLLAPPYRVPASLVSLMFLIYLVGTVGSSAVGRMAARFGRRRVMVAGSVLMTAGTLVTLLQPLAAVIAGLVIATFGFFVAHAIAAGWSGVLVPAARSQATALYSLWYYLGSAVLGYLGALIFGSLGWAGAAWCVAAWAALAAAVCVTMPTSHPAASLRDPDGRIHR